ncbi:hypothetical protein pdam_00012436, partial [Pocillopora damicornis]
VNRPTAIWNLVCSASVLLVRANLIGSRSFIRPVMFDLELEWTILPLPLKSKMATIIFDKKILSTRSPKLRLLCRLHGIYLFYMK